jgi:hypothetical protein
VGWEHPDQAVTCYGTGHRCKCFSGLPPRQIHLRTSEVSRFFLQLAGLESSAEGSGKCRVDTRRKIIFAFQIIPGIATSFNPAKAANQGAQRILGKGDKVLCLLRLGGLASVFVGGRVRRVFLIEFYLLRRTLPPIPLHPSESEVVYDGFRFDTRQDPKDMTNAIPSL